MPGATKAVCHQVPEDALRGAVGQPWQILEGRVGLGPRGSRNGQYSLNDLSVSPGDRAEGAENKTSDKANNNRGLSNGGGGKSRSGAAREGQALESRMKQLSLQCSKGRDGLSADRKMVQIG